MTLAMAVLALALAQDDPARALRDAERRYGALPLERLVEGARELRATGSALLPALRAAALEAKGDERRRLERAIRVVETRARLTPRFLASFPYAEELLADGAPAAWSAAFVEATRSKGDRPAHLEIGFVDLEPLVLPAIEDVRNTAALKEIFRVVGEGKMAALAPGLLDWIRRVRGCPSELAGALLAIGDPSAVSLILDHPSFSDGCVMHSAIPALVRSGPVALPECRRRAADWKREMTMKRTGLLSSIEVLRALKDEALVPIRLDLLDFIEREPARLRSGFEPLLMEICIEDHSARCLDILWGAVDRPEEFRRWILYEQGWPPAAARPFFTELWTRLRDRPGAEEARATVGAIVARTAPEVLTRDPSIPSGRAEATAVMSALRHDTLPAEVASGVRRVETFLERSPDRILSFSLGVFELERRRYARAERFLAGADPSHAQTRTYLGRARLLQGKVAEAEADFRAALATAADGTARTDLLRELEAVASVPRAGALRWRASEPRLGDGAGPPWDPDSWTESAEGRQFSLGKQGTLVAVDPFRETARVMATGLSGVRDFMPLDATRVFVARHNGTGALYEEGRDGPAWEIPFSLGNHSCLSASPHAITAADEAGVLKAIDPATGKTLWTRKVEGLPWKGHRWSSDRGSVAQGPGRIAVPAKSWKLEIVDLSSGASLRTIDPGMRIGKLASCEGTLVVARTDGTFAAFAWADGAERWTRPIDEGVDYPTMDLGLSSRGETLVAASNASVKSIDVATGRIRWSWVWSPAEGFVARPGDLWIAPVVLEDGVFGVVTWDAGGERSGRRIDVFLLSKDGVLLFRQPAPSFRGGTSADAPLWSGRAVAVRRGPWEIWERP